MTACWWPVCGGAHGSTWQVRLGVRLESFARYAASDAASTVRGLHLMDASARAATLDVARSLRQKLDSHALPVLHAWYARLRRELNNNDACVVAAHLALIVGGAVDGAVGASERELSNLEVFGIVSSRVFLNVHHDFEIEPELPLRGQTAPKRAEKHVKPKVSERLGAAPLDLFDSFGVSLNTTLRWMADRPKETSALLEGVRRTTTRHNSSPQQQRRHNNTGGQASLRRVARGAHWPAVARAPRRRMRWPIRSRARRCGGGSGGGGAEEAGRGAEL